MRPQRSSTSSRRRRTSGAITAVVPLVVCLFATTASRPAAATPEDAVPVPVPVAAAAAAAPSTVDRATRKKLVASPSRPMAGERTRFKARIPGNGRPVVLQCKAGKRWLTIARTKVRKGRFDLATRVRKTATYRVHAPARSGRASYTKRKRVKLARQRVRIVAAAAPFVVGLDRTLTAEVLPARKGRKVRVQARTGSQWRTVATGTSTGAGMAAVAVRGTTPGTAAYRVVAAEHRGAKASPASTGLTVRTAPAVERITNLPPGETAFDANVSANGRWVAFTSAISLLASDVDAYNDVYLFDRATGALTHVLPQTNHHTAHPVLSADGRFLAVQSLASNLEAEPDYDYDVFVLDRQSGALDLVSATAAGQPGNDDSYLHSMTEDGRRVAFSSYANNLLPILSPAPPDTSVRLPWLRDRVTGTTRALGRIGAGWSDGNVFEAQVAPLGGLVTFPSSDENLATPGHPDTSIYAMDVAPSGTASNRRLLTPLARANNPHLSRDGKVLAFSTDDGLAAADTNAQVDAYVRRPDGSYELVGPLGSQDTSTYGISGDGRHVLVQTENVLPGDGNGNADDIALWDRVTQTARLVTPGADAGSFQPAMSSDASVVAFSSDASNLVPGSTAAQHLYVRVLR